MSNDQPPTAAEDGARADGTLPSYPTQAGHQQMVPAPPRPPPIATAVKLMYAGAVLSLIGLIVTLLSLSSLKTELRDEIAESNPDFTTQDLDSLYQVTVGVAVVFGLVGTALWLWMAWKNGQGRGWARVVATVLGGLNLVSSILTIAAGASLTVSEILTVINLILAIVILFLLWRRDSSAFYVESSSRRRLG
jgi:hypothetical protein